MIKAPIASTVKEIAPGLTETLKIYKDKLDEMSDFQFGHYLRRRDSRIKSLEEDCAFYKKIGNRLNTFMVPVSLCLTAFGLYEMSAGMSIKKLCQ